MKVKQRWSKVELKKLKIKLTNLKKLNKNWWTEKIYFMMENMYTISYNLNQVELLLRIIDFKLKTKPKYSKKKESKRTYS